MIADEEPLNVFIRTLIQLTVEQASLPTHILIVAHLQSTTVRAGSFKRALLSYSRRMSNYSMILQMQSRKNYRENDPNS